MKSCPKCATVKPLSEFYNNNGRKSGKRSNCKDCDRRYRSTYLSKPENRAKNCRNQAEYRTDPETRAKKILNAAIQRDPDCAVTLDHVLNGIRREYCPVTGIKFDLTRDGPWSKNRRYNPYSPSLDRIDSRFGYTNENTRIVIWQYNLMKGELTDEEVDFVCRRVVARDA